MKINILIFLIIVLPTLVSAKDFNDLRPSKATLSMSSGDMEVWLIKKEGSIWEMRSFVDGGRVFEREEVSVFELKKDSLTPIDHKLRMRILFKKIKTYAYFDWENNKLDFQEGKDKGSINLLDGALGPATAQLQMRLDLRSLDLKALPKKMDYFVYFRGKIKERTYTIKGFEEIDTPMGKFKALKISRDFPIGEEREQVYWFAPEL